MIKDKAKVNGNWKNLEVKDLSLRGKANYGSKLEQNKFGGTTKRPTIKQSLEALERTLKWKTWAFWWKVGYNSGIKIEQNEFGGTTRKPSIRQRLRAMERT